MEKALASVSEHPEMDPSSECGKAILVVMGRATPEGVAALVKEGSDLRTAIYIETKSKSVDGTYAILAPGKDSSFAVNLLEFIADSGIEIGLYDFESDCNETLVVRSKRVPNPGAAMNIIQIRTSSPIVYSLALRFANQWSSR